MEKSSVMLKRSYINTLGTVYSYFLVQCTVQDVALVTLLELQKVTNHTVLSDSLPSGIVRCEQNSVLQQGEQDHDLQSHPAELIVKT